MGGWGGLCIMGGYCSFGGGGRGGTRIQVVGGFVDGVSGDFGWKVSVELDVVSDIRSFVLFYNHNIQSFHVNIWARKSSGQFFSSLTLRTKRSSEFLHRIL